MSVESKTGTSAEADGVTIPFGRKFTESENFTVVFQEGMALVEETAAYLDGDGRVEAKKLEGSASLAYATESMRLTTRLMQLASWLLIRRAVKEGEMTPEQAYEEKNRVQFQNPSSTIDEKTYAALPERLKELNEASMNLHRRIVAIDRLLMSELEGNDETGPGNAIGDHMSRLAEAFGPMVELPEKRDVPSGESA